MTQRKIDPDQLREMVAAGATFLEVQARFNVIRKSVVEACWRNGIEEPVRQRLGTLPRAKPAPALSVVRSQPEHPPRTASLMATGGRYADLAAWAQAQGVTEVQARQAWFRARAGMKGGAV